MKNHEHFLLGGAIADASVTCAFDNGDSDHGSDGDGDHDGDHGDGGGGGNESS